MGSAAESSSQLQDLYASVVKELVHSLTRILQGKIISSVGLEHRFYHFEGTKER